MAGKIKLGAAELQRLCKMMYNRSFAGGGLVINAGGAATFKTVNTVPYVVDGVHKSKAAAGALTFAQASGAALASLAVLQKIQYAVVVDAAGNIKTQPSAIVAVTKADPDLPVIPAGYSVIGKIRVVLAGAAVFVPNTTLLDAANVTVTYTDLTWVDSGNDSFDYAGTYAN
jgi:hypothetical protein